MMIARLLTVIGLLLPLAARAIIPAPCEISAKWVGWDRPTVARSPRLEVGSASYFELSQPGKLELPFINNQIAFDKSFGGTIGLRIPHSGIVDLAISTDVSVQVLRNGQVIAFETRPFAPDCSGIQQTLRWKAKPGKYAIVIGRSWNATIELMAVYG